MVGRVQLGNLLRSSETVTTNLASLWRNCFSMSTSLLRGLESAATAPREMIARYTMTNPGQLGESTSTTSRGFTPNANNPAAVRFTQLLTCMRSKHTHQSQLAISKAIEGVRATYLRVRVARAARVVDNGGIAREWASRILQDERSQIGVREGRQVRMAPEDLVTAAWAQFGMLEHLHYFLNVAMVRHGPLGMDRPHLSRRHAHNLMPI